MQEVLVPLLALVSFHFEVVYKPLDGRVSLLNDFKLLQRITQLVVFVARYNPQQLADVDLLALQPSDVGLDHLAFVENIHFRRRVVVSALLMRSTDMDAYLLLPMVVVSILRFGRFRHLNAEANELLNR